MKSWKKLLERFLKIDALDYRWHSAKVCKGRQTLWDEKSGRKRERNRVWHSDGRRRMTCMDAMPGKGSILFYANLPNNCIHECPAPQSSYKFPCLYRFQSAAIFCGRPTTVLGGRTSGWDLFLLVESLQGRSKDGWISEEEGSCYCLSFPFIF